MARRGSAISMMAAAMLWLSGCGVFRGALTTDLEPGPSYPAEAERLGTLDIQVARQGREVTLTNATARSFGPSRLWLNRWFSRKIDSLAIGETLQLPLAEFRDEHGEAMPGGGFFATVAPEPISLAELQTDQGLAGLIVVRRQQP